MLIDREASLRFLAGIMNKWLNRLRTFLKPVRAWIEFQPCVKYNGPKTFSANQESPVDYG